MELKQDFFISHASDDKPGYIEPLANSLTKRKITFWLDSHEIEWGDSLALKINEGLRDSRHLVLCLSEAFLSRPWPETEMNAAFTRRTSDEKRKVLPLILNDKDRILAHYPLIAGLTYREYANPDTVADELAKLINNSSIPEDHIQVVIESIHTGRLSNIVVSPNASVEWLADRAKRGIGLRDSLDTGGFQRFRIRWVLVDVNAEDAWKAMNLWDRKKVYAIVKRDNGIEIATRSCQRLADIGIYSDVVFHLYAIEDNYHMVLYCPR